MYKFSALILTKNEEISLPKCLNSISKVSEVIVYDSYSTDNTKKIIEEYGAHLVYRKNQDKSKPFGGDESYHRNWIFENFNFKHEWVLILDADETPSLTLLETLNSIVQIYENNPKYSPHAFSIKRIDHLFNKPLKFVQATKNYIRFVKPKFVHYERLINCDLKVDGKVSSIKDYILHFPFEKGFGNWIEKHNIYSSYEANQMKSEFNILFAKAFYNLIYSKSKSEFKRNIKILYYKLPLRPLIRFIYLYIFKLGFLDGYPGFIYAILQAFYELQISLKSGSKP